MEISNFVAIARVGVILSTAIQLIKGKFGESSTNTKLLTIGLSIAVGVVYVAIQSTPYFQTIIGILASASTVYSLLLKK